MTPESAQRLDHALNLAVREINELVGSELLDCGSFRCCLRDIILAHVGPAVRTCLRNETEALRAEVARLQRTALDPGSLRADLSPNPIN